MSSFLIATAFTLVRSFFSLTCAGTVTVVMQLGDIFCREKPVPQKTFPMQGTLINTNTVEAFRTYNKMELIQSVGQQVVN